MKNKLLSLIAILFLLFNLANAQSNKYVTTKGKDFWVGFMKGFYGSYDNTYKLSLYVSSDVNTSGILYYPSGATQNFNVTGGATLKLDIDTSYSAFQEGNIAENKGLHITTQDSCNVFCLTYALASSDASMVLPTPSLGYSYIASTYYPKIGGVEKYSLGGSYIVVATENNTKIEIFNKYGSGYQVTPNYTVYLNKGQVMRFFETKDLSGTKIRSVDYMGGCKKIAVFSGSYGTTVGNCWAVDHIYEELYPTDTWGYNYATIPFKKKDSDLFRVMASQDNTTVTINGVNITTLSKAGDFYEFSTNTPQYISTNWPSLVTQFCKGSDCDVSLPLAQRIVGDPFMIYPNAVEQSIKYLTFNAFTSPIITEYWLNVLTKTSATGLITIDGNNIGAGSFSQIPGNANYSYAQIQITQGNHTLVSDSGFTAVIYGYGNQESYGYLAGAGVKKLDDFILSTGNNAICAGSSVQFTSNTPTPLASNWEWNFGDGTTGTGSSVSHAFQNPGTYTVSLILTKPDICLKDTVKKAITIAGFSANIDPLNDVLNVLCNGQATGSAMVTIAGGSGPYSYSWNTNPAQTYSGNNTTHTATGLVAGNYTVVMSDQSGCTNSQPISISQPNTALSISTINIDSVDCYGDNSGQIITTTNGTGTGPYTYSWSNGQTTATATNLTAGSYTLQVTDANGCTAANSNYNVGQPAAALSATLNVGQTNVLCYGNTTGNASVNVTGGTTSYTYSWNNGQTTATLSNIGAGTYSVVVTDKRGCTTTVSGVTITQPTDLLLAQASSTNATCGQGDGAASVSVSGGTHPYTSVTWDSSGTIISTDSVVTNLFAGTYTVTVIDANGCSETTIATVSNSNGPTGSLSVLSHVDCYGYATGSATATINSGTGTPPYTYLWGNGQTNATATGLSSGQHGIIVTDATGCVLPLTITINQPSAVLDVNITPPTNILCLGIGQSGGIQTTVSGGTSNYTYSWSNGASTSNINNLPAGAYSVLVTDANGCKDSATTVITQPSQQLVASAATTTSVKCYGGFDGSATISVAGDPSLAPYTYSWPNGSTGSSLTNVSSGSYIVTVTDQNGCQDTALVVITQPQNPLTAAVSGNITDVLCNGQSTGSATVSAAGGTQNYTYSWSNSQTGPTATGLSVASGSTSQSYTVQVTDANQCTFDLSVTISQPSSYPDANISLTNAVCFGTASGNASAFGIGGTLPFNYLWSNGETTNSILGLAVGTYSVLVTDGNGCTVTKTVNITQPSLVVPGITADPMEGDYPLPVNFVSTTQNADSIWWNFGDGSPITGGTTPSHTYTDDGTYTVWQYTLANQICRDSIMITIEIEEPVVINVPNVFSPNGDGSNDVFTIISTGVLELHGDIYDRWGLRMYSWDGVNAGWDGTSEQSGKPAPSGTYYYIIKTLDNEDHEEIHKGFIQLIR